MIKHLAKNAEDNYLIRNVKYENLQINKQIISDNMSGKPAWDKTLDMARFLWENLLRM